MLHDDPDRPGMVGEAIRDKIRPAGKFLKGYNSLIFDNRGGFFLLVGCGHKPAIDGIFHVACSFL